MSKLKMKCPHCGVTSAWMIVTMYKGEPITGVADLTLAWVSKTDLRELREGLSWIGDMCRSCWELVS